MTEDSKTLGLLLRDYGALGVLLVLLIFVVIRLYSELNKVRSDSDDRAKRHLDQIETSIHKAAEASKEHAHVFATATVRQSEIFAASVRDLSQAQREVTVKLLELVDNKLRQPRDADRVPWADGPATTLPPLPPPARSAAPRPP